MPQIILFSVNFHMSVKNKCRDLKQLTVKYQQPIDPCIPNKFRHTWLLLVQGKDKVFDVCERDQ